MTGALQDADRTRLARTGIAPWRPPTRWPCWTRRSAVRNRCSYPLGSTRRRCAPGGGRSTARAAAVPGPAPGAPRRHRRCPGQGGAMALADRLAGLSAEKRDAEVLGLVRGHVAEVLGHAGPQTVDVHRGLQDMGFDSLTAVELRNRLGAETGCGCRRRSSSTTRRPPRSPPTWGAAGAETAGGAGALTTDIDRLAAALAAGPAGPEEHAEIEARLANLLRLWRSSANGTSEAAEDDLSSATDEELFDALDDELGMSSVD
ncbi:acyl carrier protein [Streptomyces sp. M19]